MAECRLQKYSLAIVFPLSLFYSQFCFEMHQKCFLGEKRREPLELFWQNRAAALKPL